MLPEVMYDYLTHSQKGRLSGAPGGLSVGSVLRSRRMAKIFVSHSSQDNAVVQNLVEELKKNNHQIWYDTESLRVGDSLSLAISDGLSQSQYFVIVLSTKFLRSTWCMRELGAIIGETISRPKRLILLRLDGADVPAIVSDIIRIETSSVGAELTGAIAKVKDYLAGRAWAGFETAELIGSECPASAGNGESVPPLR